MSDVGQPADASVGPGAARIYGVVLSVGVVCALAIVTVYEVTRPIIQRNRIALRQRAILHVLPGAVSSASFRWNESTGAFEEISTDDQQSELVFAGIDDDGGLVGLAIETKGMGYQDNIRLLYGYSFANQAVIGIRVLESRETPGLGDKIEVEKDDWMLKFKGLSLGNPPAAEWKVKKDGGRFDAFSGATITPRAVLRAIESALNFLNENRTVLLSPPVINTETVARD